MVNMYGFTETEVSYSLLALTGTYFFSCVLGPALLKTLPRRWIYVQGLALATVGYILVAPSTYLGLPEKSLPLVITGLAIIGASQGPTVVSTLPEALDTWKLMFDHCEGVDPYLDGMMTDVFASLHINLKCLTAMIAPIVAGAINTNYGYQEAMAFSYILTFLFMLINWVVNCGFSPFVERKAEQKRLNELYEKGKELKRKTGM